MSLVKTAPLATVKQDMDKVFERLFGGETLPLMRHLIEDRGISEADLAELRQLLDGKKKRSGERPD